MTVRDELNVAMKELAKNKKVVFLGENVINSGRIYGTLIDVPLKQCIEMPVAENLIAGTAIGLAIAGWRPVCIFQRMDFMLIAADAIINHACLMPRISGDKLKLPIIFRTIKGNLNNKFFVGYQHSKDFTHVFSPYLDVVQVPKTHPRDAYARAFEADTPTLVVEDYSRFEDTLK